VTADEHDGWYEALRTKDARFDGRIFVGVSSTGIYCRPVCRARLPRKENCTFYATAAEAEAAGYRPCLLCRPELAPGMSLVDARTSLVRRATRLLEENCGRGQSLDTLAGRLGCTDRHLRRVFLEELNIPPVRYLQTCRLLLAKSLLTDTKLSVADVAMTAGFGSLRRFNDLFKKQYRLSPTALRKQAAGTGHGDAIILKLGYRPPYRWEEMLSFLAGRAIPGVERVQDGAYQRAVCLDSNEGERLYGWVKVSNDQEKNTLVLAISPSLLGAVPQVIARTRHLFDLYCAPDAISERLISLNRLKPGTFVPGTRVPGCFDAFEMTVRTVLGQQVTVRAAGTLAARMVASLGTPLPQALQIDGMTHSFPTPATITALGEGAVDRLGSLGIFAARARTIVELAHSFVRGTIDYSLSAQPEAEIDRLLAIGGIGRWSAHYIAMRAMGWPDAFLDTDYGVKKALEPYSPGEIRELSEAWRPWRSYVTVSLWNSLAREHQT
jgi:AraC family transcriptional regulator of adaptative response / DNA-3-methyladenine glycosylase II